MLVQRRQTTPVPNAEEKDAYAVLTASASQASADAARNQRDAKNVAAKDACAVQTASASQANAAVPVKLKEATKPTICLAVQPSLLLPLRLSS